MPLDQRGFTPIELMIAVVLAGVLAAATIPNATEMNERAKEGKLKANMHEFQRAAEDYAGQSGGQYAGHAALVVSIMRGAGAEFENPFEQSWGDGYAWEDRASFSGPVTPRPGLVSYADTVHSNYAIKGFGRTRELELVLTAK